MTQIHGKLLAEPQPRSGAAFILWDVSYYGMPLVCEI